MCPEEPVYQFATEGDFHKLVADHRRLVVENEMLRQRIARMSIQTDYSVDRDGGEVEFYHGDNFKSPCKPWEYASYILKPNKEG